MNILQITSAGAKLCDERGDSAGISLGFSLGQHLSLDFDLRGSAGESGLLRPLDPAVFDVCRSFYFAISNAWNASLPPLFLRTEGISTRTTDTETLLSVAIPDTGTAPLVAALSGKSSAVFTAELSGLDDDGRAVFVWQFQVTISNRIYLGGDAPESIAADPAYLTASEVLARIASASDRAAADAAKTFEIGTVSGGTAAAVSLTAGSTADLALNFVLPRGAIVTTAGEVGIFVDGGSATLVNTITGGTATVGISGGTAIALDEDFLGVFGRCEYDLIDGDGKNITTSPDVSRQWTDDAYVITLASGFADGDYTAKPCGIKGDGVEYAAGENIEIDGNTISASFSSFPGGTVTVGATSFIASTRASADLSDYMHFFHNSEGAIDITISMNEEAYEISADLRDVESFSDVAAVLQEEIRSLGEFYGGNPAWTGATVEYTNGQFSLTPGIVTEVSVRSTLDGGDYFLGNTIGWVPGTDPVVRKPSACVPISAGTKYVVPEAIGSLTIPSTATSDSESEITWTFAGGTTTPQFSYFQDLGIVGSLPTFAAGKSYLASIKGGKMVVTEYTPGRGVFELLVKTTSANEPWGFAPYWRAGGGCQVNWGDGTVEYAPTSGQVFSHSYLVPGDHTVKIIGSCYRVVFGATGNEPMQTYRNKVYGCNFNWPALGTLTDMSSLFHTCSHLAGAGFTNVPDTVTRLSYAFDGIKALIKLTKLPPDIEDTKQAFGSATTAVASNVICDLGDLVANAPLGGYASLVNISQMFLKSGAGITGSAADFIAACAPNVDALRAFEGCPNVTDVP